MRNIFLISTDDIKGNTLIDYNVDDKTISYCIKQSQEIYLREIIGDRLLEECKDAVSGEMSGTVIEEPYLTLIDELIFNYLLNKVQSEMCLTLTMKFKNIGVSENSDTNVRTLELEQLEKLRDYYQTYVCDAANNIIDYVKTNFENKTCCKKNIS